MRKIPLLFLFLLLAAGCGLNQQVKQLKAFENCTYRIVSADSVYLAGVDVSRVISDEGIDFTSAPQLALAFLQKRMPFQAHLNFEITNPGETPAGINGFEYLVLLNKLELTAGFMDKTIRVEPDGGTTIVPLNITSDIYPFISTASNRKAIAEFLSSGGEQKVPLTLKIKPVLLTGEKRIDYPGYISINKEISNKMLISLLDNHG